MLIFSAEVISDTQRACELVGGGWSITSSASSYAYVAGVFAAVMLPFLGLIVTEPRNERTIEPRSEQRRRRDSRAPILIFAAFLFSLTAAYLYALVSGDNECLRANAAAAPVGVIFGAGAACSLVGICWLVQHRSISGYARNIFLLIALAGFIVITLGVGVTITDLVVYGERSYGWPSWEDTTVILLPGSAIFLAGVVRYVFTSMPQAARRVGSELRRHTDTNATITLLLLYLYCAITASLIDDNGFTIRHSEAWLWVLLASVLGLFFGAAFTALLLVLPRPTLRSVSRYEQVPQPGTYEVRFSETQPMEPILMSGGARVRLALEGSDSEWRKKYNEISAEKTIIVKAHGREGEGHVAVTVPSAASNKERRGIVGMAFDLVAETNRVLNSVQTAPAEQNDAAAWWNKNREQFFQNQPEF